MHCLKYWSNFSHARPTVQGFPPLWLIVALTSLLNMMAGTGTHEAAGVAMSRNRSADTSQKIKNSTILQPLILNSSSILSDLLKKSPESLTWVDLDGSICPGHHGQALRVKVWRSGGLCDIGSSGPGLYKTVNKNYKTRLVEWFCNGKLRS